MVAERRAPTSEHRSGHESLHVPALDDPEAVIEARHAARTDAREDEPGLFSFVAMLQDRQTTRFVGRTIRQASVRPCLRRGPLLEGTQVIRLGPSLARREFSQARCPDDFLLRRFLVISELLAPSRRCVPCLRIGTELRECLQCGLEGDPPLRV